MQIRLEGAILDSLTNLFLIKDGFTVGQKLTQIEKTAKKRFYDMSDEEIYYALQDTINNDYYSDTYELDAE